MKKKKNSENPHFYKSVDSGWTPSPPSVEKIHTFNFFFEGFPQPQLLSTLGLQDTKNTDISELITSPCSRSSDNLLPDPYLAEPMSHMSRQSTIIQTVLCLQNGKMTTKKLFLIFQNCSTIWLTILFFFGATLSPLNTMQSWEGNSYEPSRVI